MPIYLAPGLSRPIWGDVGLPIRLRLSVFRQSSFIIKMVPGA